jgi:hypothetical protein
MERKLCYVCYSPDHLIKHCDLHSEYLSQFPKNRSTTHKPRETRPVWNHSNRVNHSNFSKDYRYPHQKRMFSKSPVPSHSDKSQEVPSQRTDKFSPTHGTAHTFSHRRPKRFNSYKRSYTSSRVPRSEKPKVKRNWVKKESTDGEQEVLSSDKGETGSVVDITTQDMGPTQIIIDHAFKTSGDYILKEFKYVTPQGEHKSVMAWVPKRN